jgi:hypothetical protein
LPEHFANKYKKSYLINTQIARDLTGFSVGDRLPTFQEFTEKHASSRGIVQKALEGLQASGAIGLEKRGKMGSYIGVIDRKLLFRLGGLESVTATMPSPVTREFAGLATGICDAMQRCPAPFNFAFIHSAGIRGAALSRMTYDFAVTSHSAAVKLALQDPDLEMIMLLEGSIYAPPFVLYGARPGVRSVFSGAVFGVDPNSPDQFFLTQRLCRGKKARILERPYITCRALFLAREIDFLVFRDGALPSDSRFEKIPLPPGKIREFSTPAILINKKNYHIGDILKSLLIHPVIAEGQAAVLEGRREVQYY